CGEEATTRLSDQQLQLATTDDRATVSQPLASRVVLQMDQTTPAHQKVLRHFNECLEDSNLDCHLGLRPRSHCQKGVAPRWQSLHNSPDLECHIIRENADFTGSFINRMRIGTNYFLQTTDPIRLTLGHYCFKITNCDLKNLTSTCQVAFKITICDLEIRWRSLYDHKL